MDNGLIGWIPEEYSLRLIISVVIFVVPAFCLLMWAHFSPFIVWGVFWKQYGKSDNSDTRKFEALNKILVFITICIAVTMYIVWVRWLWSFFDADNTWLVDILYGKGNSN
jgi:hypothetical protein